MLLMPLWDSMLSETMLCAENAIQSSRFCWSAHVTLLQRGLSRHCLPSLPAALSSEAG